MSVFSYVKLYSNTAINYLRQTILIYLGGLLKCSWQQILCIYNSQYRHHDRLRQANCCSSLLGMAGRISTLVQFKNISQIIA